MDEMDLDILNFLSSDARMPFSKIAKKLGVATDTIIRRFGLLEKEGIILGSTVVLSSQACGFEGQCDLNIVIDSESNVVTLHQRLLEIPGIFLTGRMWGDYDLYAEIFFRTISEVGEVIKQIRQIDGVLQIDAMVYASHDLDIPAVFTFEIKDLFNHPIFRK